MNSGDTIAALSTPVGRGALAVVRVSGSEVPAIAKNLAGVDLPPRRACLKTLRDSHGEWLDQSVLTFYPAPQSPTGEDLLEISCHGAPTVVRRLLQQLFTLGARAAGPGEFSRRAFEAGKIDLVQAQAVADLIAASSDRAARCAGRSLQGDVSLEIDAILKQLIEIRIYVEGALDFSDEDIDWLAESNVRTQTQALAQQMAQLVRRARQGRTVSTGIRLVLLGPPNVGKSSLLNHFTGEDTAIVTTEPGTTRDLLIAPLQLDGIPLILVDTAGIRETTSQAEIEGVRRSWQAAAEADVILQVFDAKDGWGEADQLIAEQLLPRKALLIANKCDLLKRPGTPVGDSETALCLSAKTGAGVDQLKAHIVDTLQLDRSLEESEFMAHQRQIDALSRTRESLEQATTAPGGELIAEELRLAQQSLGEITGTFTADDLLGEIFGRFCIGK